MSAMTEEEGGGTPSGSPCEFAWLATVADALAAEDGDRVGLKNKRIVAAGTDLNYQYYIDIADDGGQDVLRIYCSMAATTSQRVARVAGIITVDGNDINLSAGDGPCGGACGQQQPWLADSATVGIARTLPDGAMVAFDDLVVTHEATSGGYLYAQDQSRAAGIRVNRGEVTTSVTRGDTIDVLGELGHIAATGEQFVDASAITVTGTTGSLRPVKVLHREIGGNGFDIGGLAPPTVGLFVKTFAKVTAKGADYLDVTDFTRVNSPDDTRVFLPFTPPGAIQPGDWVEVVGIAAVTGALRSPALTPAVLVDCLGDLTYSQIAIQFTYPDPGPYGHPRAVGTVNSLTPVARIQTALGDENGPGGNWTDAEYDPATGVWSATIPEPYGISTLYAVATDSLGNEGQASKELRPVTVLTGAESAISPFVYGTAITWRAKINGKKNGAAGGDGVLRKTGPDGADYDWDSYVLDGLLQLRPGSLRFGDATSNTYKWRFGVGPQSGRPPLYVNPSDPLDDTVSLNAYGTDEHLALCELLGAEPIIPLPWQAESPNGITTAINESVNWVRYCTELHPLDENPPRQPDPAWTPSLIDFGVLLPLYDNTNPGQYETDDEVRIDTMNAMVPEDSRTVPGHTLAFTCIADTAGTEAGVSAPYYGSAWRTYWQFRQPIETRPTGAYLSTDSNVPAGYWGWLRTLFNTAHRQPYATTYWEVGNQVFQLSTVEAEDYAALFNSYAQALRGAYPAIQLGACSPTWREEQYPDWPAYVLNPYNLVDYGFAIPHLYVATQTGAATQHNYNVLFNDIIESKVGGKAGDLQLFRDVAFPNSVSLWPTEHNTMFGLFEYKGHAPVADNFKLKSALAVTSLQMKLVSEHAQGFNLFHACAVSHGNLANEPKTERTIVVDLVREPRSEGGVSIPASERRWVTPTFHAQSLLSHFGRGAAVATDAAYQEAGDRDVFAQVYRQDDAYRLFFLNTNATEERVQSIYLGAGAEPVGGLITYTLQADAESPMEASNEPAAPNHVGPPAPGYYLPLETNYFVWSLPPASMTAMDIQLASETSEPRNLMGHVACPETNLLLRGVTVDALVDGDVAASATTNVFGVYEFRGLPPGEYVFRVNAPGYDVVEPDVVIEPGEYYGLVFEAHPTLSGWVLRYGSGVPVEGALVWADGTDCVTQADADGQFFLCLPPGEYTVMAATHEKETPLVGVAIGAVTVPLTSTPQCVEFTLDSNPIHRKFKSCYEED